MNRFSLAGKNALVTGAGRGIGRALALGLAEAGASVACVARTQSDIDGVAREIMDRGGRAAAIVADVTDSAAVHAAFARADGELGGIDILVNNAGTNIRTAIGETTDENWHHILRTNLDSAFFCSREAAAGMRTRGRGGRIINIGSVAGLVALRTGVAYAATKGAIAQMTRTLAMELADAAITVNTVAPWYFRTPLTEKLLADPAFVGKVLRVTPLGRVGELEDLVGPVVFLASGAAAYVTGQVLPVDGGMTIAGFDPTK